MAILKKEIHSEIFDWLYYEWSRNEQRVEGIINPYFATRFRRDSKFNSGFYFQGNQEYIAITFWTGSDYMHKTPNIFFEIHSKYGIRAWMVGRDSELKKQYFKQLTNKMNGWSPGKESGTFYKEFSTKTFHYMFYLSEFIKNDKKIIDEEIKASIDKLDIEDEFLLEDEYSSKFGFISSNQFDQFVTRVAEQRKREEREKKLKYILQKSEGIRGELELSLESISITNYHDITDVNIDNLPATANWIFLTGMNGFGKTSVLQAITLGLTNYKGNTIHMDSKVSIKIGFLEKGKNEVNSSKMYYEDEFRSLNNYVSAYGPSRLLVVSKESANEDFLKDSNINSLFDSTPLKNIDYELGRASTDDPEYFEALKELIVESTDGFISEIKVENGLKVLYKERLNNNEFTDFLPRINLSAGYRGIIHLVGDILIRLYNKEIHKSSKDITGIVLIDEIENHLHPSLQKKISGLLSKSFPKIQFIVSTHSPIPLFGAPKNSIILKVSRSLKDGIKINRLKKLEKEIEHLLPNSLLTSDVFDFDFFEGKSEEEFNSYFLENNYKDIEKNQQLEERLKKIDASIFPDDLFRDKD